MPLHSGYIVHITAACDQVGPIGIKGLPQGGRSACIVFVVGILAAARQLASPFLRLPEGQDLLAVCVFVIVGKAEHFNPTATLAVSCDDAPGASRTVASVTQAHSRRDSDRVRFFSKLQLQTRGAGFELGGSYAARHVGFALQCPASVPPMCVNGYRPATTDIGINQYNTRRFAPARRQA